MTIFVDTSAFLAVLDAADAHQPEAAEIWSRVVQEGHSLLTTSYVLVETLSLLHHQVG
jgi:predicted nucleic acid-binding protein